MKTANTPLVNFTKLCPNHSEKRTSAISRITPHAVVGQLIVTRICDCFKDGNRQATTTALGLTEPVPP